MEGGDCVCKKKKTKTSNKQRSFLFQFKWWIIIPIIVLTATYVIIYLCFLGKGLLPAGEELEKKDWLAFLGGYLSFAGTLLISAITILQTNFYNKKDKDRTEQERKKAIQPLFSINIAAINSSVSGEVYVFNPNKPDSFPTHENITIEIENVGEHPIRNVIVFNEYLWQMLKPNDKKQIQVAYSDSPDIEHSKEHLIQLFETEHERTEHKIPKRFGINYEDIDGNEMYQLFELKEFDGTMYYSLDKLDNA